MNGIHEVSGSIPLGSTNSNFNKLSNAQYAEIGDVSRHIPPPIYQDAPEGPWDLTMLAEGYLVVKQDTLLDRRRIAQGTS